MGSGPSQTKWDPSAPGENFPAYLEQHRVSRGLTQQQLGERVGVSGDAVSHWEAGRRRPSLPMLRRLALALDMPLGTLMGERDPLELEPVERRLILALRRLPRRTRLKLAQRLESWAARRLMAKQTEPDG